MAEVSRVFYPVEGKTKKRKAAYCRVSTAVSAQLESESVQERYFVELLMADNSSEFVGVYTDVGRSGTTVTRRMGFQQLIADCREGKIDCIHTKSISRFARNVVDAIRYVRELKALGVDVYFERENLHTIGSEGELMLTLMASMAEAESASISENIRWSKRRGFAQGETRGIPIRGVYGLDRDGQGRVVINEGEARVIKRVFAEYLNGYGIYVIASRLNADGIPTPRGGRGWGFADIQNMLRNEKHCGDCLLQKTYKPDYRSKVSVKNTGELPMYYIEGAFPAAVDRQTWELAQLEMKWRADHRYRGYSERYPFKQRMICRTCGRPMVVETGRNHRRHCRIDG